MIYENTPPTHPDRRNLELSIDEAKRVGKYIDQKKGEAMSKLKVGEIQSAVLGDVPVDFLFFIFYFYFPIKINNN